MFIQVLQGRVYDRTDVREAVDGWVRDLAPGAGGWLGSTAGVTADDMFIMLTRFESTEAARTSSNRHEHHEWWTETAKLFVGDVALHDCPVTDVMFSGGSDDAGFVQVVQGVVPDATPSWVLVGRSADSGPALGPARMAIARRVMQLMLCQMEPTLRPDFLGGAAGFDPHDGTLTEICYFTSEAATRKGEQKPLPPDLAALWQEWQALLPDARYYDFTEPWLYSPSS